MKKCPICGNDNGCTHDVNCWCMSFEFKQKTKDYLDKNYKGSTCVCKDCVDKLNKTL